MDFLGRIKNMVQSTPRYKEDSEQHTHNNSSQLSYILKNNSKIAIIGKYSPL